MSSAIRSILPRVPMNRIPVAAFVNATAVHPSGYSSAARSNAASNVPNTKLDIPKEYLNLPEVKHDDYDSPPPPSPLATDEKLLMDLAMTRSRSPSRSSSFSSSSPSSSPSSDRDHDIPLGSVAAETEKHMTQQRQRQARASSAKGAETSRATSLSMPGGFEQTVLDQYQAAIGHCPPLSEYASPTSRRRTGRQRHRRELASVLFDRLKQKPEGLSQYAWDAIRAVESQKLLKQDRATTHALHDEDKADARV